MSAVPQGLDATHAPDTQSWVESANARDTDFPIQNLPFGRFRHNELEPWQIGVAIGDRVLDLHATGLIDHNDMHRLMAAPVAQRRALRLAIWEGLREGSALQKVWADALLRQTEVELGLPCEVGDYTDFYTGIHHATTVGKLFRPDNPLLPNYKYVPIGYHGRASTIRVSGPLIFAALAGLFTERAGVFDIHLTPAQMQGLPIFAAITAAAAIVEIGHGETALCPVLDARIEHGIARRSRAAMDEHHQWRLGVAGHGRVEKAVGFTRAAWVAQGLWATDLLGGQRRNAACQDLHLAGLAIDGDHR